MDRGIHCLDGSGRGGGLCRVPRRALERGSSVQDLSRGSSTEDYQLRSRGSSVEGPFERGMLAKWLQRKMAPTQRVLERSLLARQDATCIFSSLLFSSLELSDTKVYAPYIRARLGTAAHGSPFKDPKGTRQRTRRGPEDLPGGEKTRQSVPSDAEMNSGVQNLCEGSKERESSLLTTYWSESTLSS